MPQGSVPPKYVDLLESASLAHLATIDAAGRPQVNPVWFVWENGEVLIGVLDFTKKLVNVRLNPRVALSIADLANPGRYLEIRGDVTDITLQPDDDFVNFLSRRYTGADYPEGGAGAPCYKLSIQVNSWTAQG